GEIPSLEWFCARVDGLNITSPYKPHFIDKLEIDSELVRNLGAINTIGFFEGRSWGTNTDILAVEVTLSRFLRQFEKMQILLLGGGVMAKVTEIVAQELGIPLFSFSRKNIPDLGS